MKRIILALAFLTSGIQVASAEAENISEGKILEIRVLNIGIEVLQENAVFPEGCDKAKYFGVTSDREGEYYMLLQPLLAAYQSGRDVRLKTGSCIKGITADIEEVWLK